MIIELRADCWISGAGPSMTAAKKRHRLSTANSWRLSLTYNFYLLLVRSSNLMPLFERQRFHRKDPIHESFRISTGSHYPVRLTNQLNASRDSLLKSFSLADPANLKDLWFFRSCIVYSVIHWVYTRPIEGQWALSCCRLSLDIVCQAGILFGRQKNIVLDLKFKDTLIS